MTKFEQYLLKIYGNKINVRRLYIHYYLGMDLDYFEIGVVKVLMIKYLQKVLAKFTEELREKLATPEAEHLFQVRG